MNQAQKFVLALISLGVFTTLITTIAAPSWAAILVAILLCILTYLLRPLIMPKGYGANKIRMLSLLGAFAATASWNLWSGVIDGIVKSLISSPGIIEKAPYLKSITIDSEPSISVLFFLTACIFIVNYFMRDKSIGGDHPDAIDKEFPEEKFQKKLHAFCSILDKHLIQIDLESNWSPEYYTDLEAEVEILSSHGRVEKKKVLNLQQAIRSDRFSQTFLVLGVPGAGKSVALRKLARDMLREVSLTQRIPIYINLREWHMATNLVSRPTIESLESFVMSNLKQRGDLYTEHFVDDYFRKLLRHGRLFFIFDSFDEIPELLDADENSEIISELSSILSRFMSSSPASRGLLASRVFRRPTNLFHVQKLLEIRPLSEPSIIDALDRFPNLSSKFKAMLFNNRADLVPIARNPFLMTLLGEWINNNQSLPNTQAEIYEFYLRKKIDECSQRVAALNLNTQEILDVTTKIAWFVFSSPTLGLEAPVVILENSVASKKINDVIDILSYARIARVTSGGNKSFAFVHRRFLEYFVTKVLLENPSEAPIEHIPTDSRGRDALVLYAQLCTLDEAKRLAEICWGEVTENFDDPATRLRAIHSLRFIIEAFYSRRDAISKIIDPLKKFIRKHTKAGSDIILAKICLEGTGLIPARSSVYILHKAIMGNDAWLQETAFRACRNQPRLEHKLERSVANYIKKIPIFAFCRARSSLVTSLSLSDSMRDVLRTAKLRSLNLNLTGAAILLTGIISPHILAASVTLSFIIIVTRMVLLALPAPKQMKELILAKSELSKKPWEVAIFVSRHVLSGLLIYQILISHTSLGDILRSASDAFLVHSETIRNTPLFAELSKFDLDRNDAFFWGLLDTPRYITSSLLAILAVFTVDWLLMIDAARRTRKIIRTARSLISFLRAVSPTVGGVVLSITLARYLLSHEEFYKVAITVSAIIFSIVITCLAASACKREFFYWQDTKLIKDIKMQGVIYRTQISEILDQLKTTRGKLYFIKRLEQTRMSAVGEWPSNFRLSVGADIPMSALARLEERWLKLDH